MICKALVIQTRRAWPRSISADSPEAKMDMLSESLHLD